MYGRANNNGAPLPPPPQPSGRPPISPSAPTPSDSSRDIPRRSPPNSSPPPRPPLIRVESSSGGSFHGRPGLDRVNSSQSSHSLGMDQDLQQRGLRRRGSVINRPHQVLFEETSGDQPITSKSLLLASLDQEAVEDEAEATLLEVLGRRQVGLDNQDAPQRHRRNRSQFLPSIDLLNLGSTSTQRPATAPSSSEAAQPLSRPPTHGRSKGSSLMGPGPSSLSGRAVSSDLTFDPHGELFDPSEQHEGLEMNATGPKETINQASSRGSNENYSNRGNRHQRVSSALPLGLERTISDSSQTSGPTGLTASGEMARRVVLTMKASIANKKDNTFRSVGEGDLPELMNTIEAHRDSDSQSADSSRKSGGVASRSRGSRSAENQSTGGSSGFSGGGRGHRPQRPFSGISSSPFSSESALSGVEKWLLAAESLQELHQIPEGEEDDVASINSSDPQEENALAEENHTFLSNLTSSHPDVPPTYPEETEEMPNDKTDRVDEQTPMVQHRLRDTLTPRKRKKHIWSITHPATGSRFYKILLWWTELRKQMKILAVAFDAPLVKMRLLAFLQNEISLFIVPALAISAFFYYQLNNPILSILPTDASISWWILFVVRHYLTLQLAHITEYVFVDVLAMRTLLISQLIGPLATLLTITAKGWPYTLSWWGVFNLLFIGDGHGSGNLFFSHWLYFTDIEMFTAENSSGGIVESDTYRGILMSMVIVGVAISLKNTVLALYLGKRIYIHYKPRLEKVMEAMILLHEVADLGDAIDDLEFTPIPSLEADQSDSKRSVASRHSNLLRDEIRASTMNDVIQKRVGNIDSDSDEEKSVEAESRGTTESTTWNRLRTESNSSDENAPLYKDNKALSQDALDKVCTEVSDDENFPRLTTTEEDFLPKDLPTMDNTEPPIQTVYEPVQGLLRNTSTTSQIKSHLESWEEPVNKQDKMDDPTIEEIVLFRKALLLLDDTHPFGFSFGPAFTRDSCIKSSKSLYKRVLSLSPGSPVLQFDVIGVLAYNMDGTFDDKKARSLVRLFRPDKFDEVSLLHFVQSCDGIYKKLRYLRASLGNSTLIDSVLESIFNSTFGFFLALTVLNVLNLNPWALLVSMSTVLVSFAFALGPSAAKLIEGMMMIAIRRPFDLGDRISIVPCTGAPDNSADPGYHDTWMVEDCNLFTTTLRLSRTNEISTVNNGSIANTRIVNHGRSHNALVNISLQMRIDVTHDQVQIVQSTLKQYVRDNPRVWTSLINFRITNVDTANGLIAYSARIQHVKSWQDLLPILQARGDIEKFCTQILHKLDIYYGGKATLNNVFIKELPDQQFFSQDAVPSGPSEIHDDHHNKTH